MKKILVLCTGNSARSQMAEGYLNCYARGHADFYSAGLHDRGVHPLAVEVMAEDNIDISGNTSKTYARFEGEHFDFLITVCDLTYKHLPGSLKANKHLHFSIPDPDLAQGNDEDKREIFRQTRETVKKHILKFIGRELSELPEPVFS